MLAHQRPTTQRRVPLSGTPIESARTCGRRHARGTYGVDYAEL